MRCWLVADRPELEPVPVAVHPYQPATVGVNVCVRFALVVPVPVAVPVKPGAVTPGGNRVNEPVSVEIRSPDTDADACTDTDAPATLSRAASAVTVGAANDTSAR